MTLFEKAQMIAGKNTWETMDFEKYGISSIFLSDGPHGIRKQLGAADHLGLNASIPSTCFPTAATIANSWDTELSEKIGNALGNEAKTLGVNVILGPGMNIKRNPLCGRNFEYFSEDPLLTGKLASGYVKGIQKNGVAATPKHFAVNSQELRRMSNDSIVDERTLREIYLSAFEMVVKEAKPLFMMTSYNKLNGEYTNENHHLLQEILYDEWQYEGVVVTDWGGSNDHVRGVIEGSHLEMPGTGVVSAVEIEQAVLNGELSESILDQRVDELLSIILGLSKAAIDPQPALSKQMIESHHQLAYQAAQESIVLLKNNQVLPLEEKSKIAFIGDFVKYPRYQGAGSSVVNPTVLDSVYDLINTSVENEVRYCQGYQRSGKSDVALIEEAVEVAKSVEIPLIFIGLTEIAESEGMDRSHMEISENQLKLVEAVAEVNNRTIVVLSGGSVVELPFANKVAGILHGYLGGQAGAKAMLDVLYGRVNPSGKLAETYPIRYSDIPSSSYYPGLEKTSEYREGLFVGYRYFNTVEKEVLFSFGYGLSYTSFEYSNLAVSNNQIKVTVKNTGTMLGAEIVQAYVEHESSRIIYPKQQLIGFTKVVLEAGESKEVLIDFSDRAFQYFNTLTNQWEVDGGRYLVSVASNSRDIRLSEVLEIAATTDRIPHDVSLTPHYFAGKVNQIGSYEFEILLGHPIPEANWNKKEKLHANDSISQLFYAKGYFAKFVYKVMTHLLEKSVKKGQPNLNLYFNYNMTFRAIAKMMGGKINQEMVSHLLTMVNGEFFRGSFKFIKAYFNHSRSLKR